MLSVNCVFFHRSQITRSVSVFMSNQATEFTPPMLQGVSASKVYLPALQPEPKTVFAYLCTEFKHIEATEWQQRFDDGLVYAADGKVLSLDSPYTPNTHVFYYRFLKNEIHVPFEHEILYENEHLLVVDKPHFLTISPTGQYVQETLLVRLKQHTQNEDLTPIHRLDRETAGVVLFCKTKAARGAYQQLFAERQVTKHYHAIAAYKTDLVFPLKIEARMEKSEPFYTMQIVDGVPNSKTDIEIIEKKQNLAKYLLKPLTGKQHQLRVHLSHLGIPILNDPFYPSINHKADDDFTQPLQLLAKYIAFQDPISQQHMSFISRFELTL
jgi:tRNA pseudouridine32 synthase / 23S rRNA pseudouridine746 synthase